MEADLKIQMKTFPQVNGLSETATVSRPAKGSPTLRQSLMAFTESTTLHGIRFIFVENVAIIRRLLWVVLFLVCSVLMSVQIIERIVYFYNYPLTVNVRVNFNNTLTFPSLTLCNQNTFRATAATEHNLYRLLEALYSEENLLDEATLMKYNATHTTLEDVFQTTAHRKEDFIVTCQWQDKPCGPENFTEILTDHGLCYSFNDDPDNQMMVSSTGAEYGLRVTLNVEQYEYMPGPHSAAGVKVLLHDQKEFPNVADLGLAVPTGSHTYVGIQLTRIQNLPKPHGACRSEKSPYYNRYSYDACQLTCMTERLHQLCGCRHMYMPHVNGAPPVCTLEQLLTCYTKEVGAAKDFVRENCKCPIPCDFLVYDPTISFATTSVYATDRLLASTAVGDLRNKYLYARETTSSMDPLKFQPFKDLEESMRLRFQELKTTIIGGVRDSLVELRDSLQSIHDRMNEVWSKKLHLLRWQNFVVAKNFIRPREAMEERTLSVLAFGYQEYSFQVDSKIRLLANSSNNEMMSSQNLRTAVYIELLNMLNAKIDLADRAHQNYTELYNAYEPGQQIFGYRYLHEPFSDNKYITPKVLLNHSLHHSEYAKNFNRLFEDSILNIKSAVFSYMALANQSYFTGVLEPTELREANVNFLIRGREFYFGKSMFYTQSIEYPLGVMGSKIEEFERRWRVFEADFQFMHDKIELLIGQMDHLQHTTMSNLDMGLDVAQAYIRQDNVTKMYVAETLTSPTIYDGISALGNFFNNIRSRGQNVYDGWPAFTKSAIDIWAMVLDDENMQVYYEYKNMTEFLRRFAEVSLEVTSNFTALKHATDFRFLLGNVDNLFLRSLEKMMTEMTKYLDESELNSQFIKENFLQLDVFYKEKSYEQITQQRGYDVFALLCDVGGSMGLFVGASVMTVYELFDFGLRQSVYRITYGIKHLSRGYSSRS